jgi:hypothetical protein
MHAEYAAHMEGNSNIVRKTQSKGQETNVRIVFYTIKMALKETACKTVD